MRFLNCQVLSGADTSSVVGSQIDSNQLINASFQAVFADSTAVGTIQLQASNDITADGYQASTFTVTNWTNIPSGSVAVTAGGSVIITLTEFSYRWLRVLYNRTSGGSSTVKVNMCASSV